MNKRQLADLCRAYHLPYSGNKPQLKDRLRDFSTDRKRWQRYVPIMPPSCPRFLTNGALSFSRCRSLTLALSSFRVGLPSCHSPLLASRLSSPLASCLGLLSTRLTLAPFTLAASLAALQSLGNRRRHHASSARAFTPISALTSRPALLGVCAQIYGWGVPVGE
jgi:hypothetical protein